MSELKEFRVETKCREDFEAIRQAAKGGVCKVSVEATPLYAHYNPRINELQFNYFAENEAYRLRKNFVSVSEAISLLKGSKMNKFSVEVLCVEVAEMFVEMGKKKGFRNDVTLNAKEVQKYMRVNGETYGFHNAEDKSYPKVTLDDAIAHFSQEQLKLGDKPVEVHSTGIVVDVDGVKVRVTKAEFNALYQEWVSPKKLKVADYDVVFSADRRSAAVGCQTVTREQADKVNAALNKA